MPDTLSLSTGVSLGLLAGIVSGVCYFIANGITWSNCERRLRAAGEEPCARCGGDPLGGDLPCICYKQRIKKFQRGAWFLRQVHKTLSLMPWSLSSDKLEQIDEEREGADGASDGEPGLTGVREFLETLSARLAGGPLDRTRVHQLYTHPACVPSRERSSTLDPDSARTGASSGASGAHAQLKRLVARVVEEAAALPALARYAAEPSTPIESSTYEDLLATAILNKVIERYQAESGSGGRSSGIHSASASPTPSERSSPRSPHAHHVRDLHRDITPPLRDEDEEIEWNEVIEETIELPKRIPFPEFGGDIVHTSETDDRDFDEVSGSDLQASDGTWEENWLFQKKKIKNIQSVPVPMLVPNSNTEYKVLIGDKDVDDTSDLSDNASDGEEETTFKSDIKNVLDSKHVIGGKSKIDDLLDIEPDSLTILDEVYIAETTDDVKHRSENNNKIENNSDVANNENEINEAKDESVLSVEIDSGPLEKPEFVVSEIHRTANYNGTANEYSDESNQDQQNNDLQFDTKSSKDTMSTYNGHEEERGYEETVDVPVQRYADSLRRKYYEEEDQNLSVTENHDEEDHIDLIPGSIAERERKKWLNYVEMPNNPYSPEAIQRRLSAKSTSSIFDTITSSRNNLSETDDKSSKSDIRNHDDNRKERNLKKNFDRKTTLSLNNIHDIDENMSRLRTNSPSSPKILRDVLAEEMPQYKRYGRDYYIREAKKSSGGRMKSYSDTSSMSSLNKSTSLDNFDNEFTSPGLLIKQFNAIATNQQYTTFSKNDLPESITTTCHLNNKRNEVSIDYDDATDQTLFSAKAIYINDDTDQKFDEILQSVSTNSSQINHGCDKTIDESELLKSPTNQSVADSFMSSSSMEDSIKIYNVQNGEIVTCKPRDSLSEDRCDMKHRDIDNVDTPDKSVEGKPVNYNLAECNGENCDGDDKSEVRVKKKKMSIDELDLPKVKDLARIFVNSTEPAEEQDTTKVPPRRRKGSCENILNGDISKSDKTNKNMYMHSLTARSISKEFRDELKLSMAIPLKVPGGSNEIPEGAEEVVKQSSRPGSPLPEPGTLKTKLAFFESLKSKFSSSKT